MRRKLLLLLVSLSLSLAAAELVMRALYHPAPIWKHPQTHYLRSPLLGWVLPPGSHSYTIDQPVSINSHGLRDDEFPLRKRAEEVRILGLGDSFTFALGVGFEALWVQQLETLLNERQAPRPFQVINAGVAGYNTRQELIYLLAEGFRFEPHIIVVAFYWNDLIGNADPLPDLGSTPLRETEQKSESASGHRLPHWVRAPLRSIQLIYQGTRVTKKLISRLNPPEHRLAVVQRALLMSDHAALEPLWQSTQGRLLQMADVAADRGIPVVLLVFPMENQVRHDYPDLIFADRLREIWEPTSMPFVDVEPAFREALERGMNPFLPYDLHPSAEGMKIAANAVYEAMLRAGFLGVDRDASIAISDDAVECQRRE